MFEKKITPVNAALVDSAEQANLKEMSVASDQNMINRSVQFGKQIAAAIYKYSLNDGGHEAYLDPFQLPYNMAPDPSCWVPTSATTGRLSRQAFLTVNNFSQLNFLLILHRVFIKLPSTFINR